MTESLDVGAGLLKLLLVIKHIWKPAPTLFLLSTFFTQNFLHSELSSLSTLPTQRSALSTQHSPHSALSTLL